jgi:hypothetical protein
MRSVAALFVLTMVAGTASVGSLGSGGTSTREPGVAPRVMHLGLSESDLAAAPATAGALLTAPRETSPFSLLALTWAPGPTPLPEVAIRTRGADGWSDWTHLHADADGPDADEAAPREGTAPLWTGDADAFQVRVETPAPGRAPALPTDLRLVLVDPGHAPTDDAAAQPSPAEPTVPEPADTAAEAEAEPAFEEAAAAHNAWPHIAARADWGADERMRERPKYTGPVRAAFVHHTAGTNRYTRRDVPRIVRAIYAFHVRGRGWADIGYNFLVDKWGRVWEGRAGGVGLPVRGAHTGGFNRDSFGIAALGDFSRRKPQPAMLESIARVIRWKFDQPDASLDPSDKTRLTSTGGGTSRYRAGTEVTFRRVSGHRDAGRTACPGDRLYAKLPALRERVAELQGAGDVEFGGARPIGEEDSPTRPGSVAPPHAPAPRVPQEPRTPQAPPKAPSTRPDRPTPPRSWPPILTPRPPAPWGPFSPAGGA